MCRLLQVGLHSGVDHVAVVIGGVAEAFYHLTPHHLSHIVGIHLHDLPIKGCRHGRLLSHHSLRFVDHPQICHAPENPVSANLSFVRVAQGVIARRRFRHTRQHGVLCKVQLG